MQPSKDQHKVPTIHEERFYKLMRLIKIDRMLKSAKITHKETPSDGHSG